MKFPFKANSDSLLLFLILLLATALRFYGLENQSLWLDELYTVNETDPSLSWSGMMEYLKWDWHPPLYYAVERFFNSIFGYTDYTARAVSAIFGVIGVWAMYLLGKEFLNKQLGLIAACLCSVNYFSVFYSQEARGYIMAFAFTIFSYLYFIKLIKRISLKNSLLYGLFTILMLYSHYYSAFIFASQGLIAIVLMFGETDNRKTYFKYFAIAGLIIVICYLPLLYFITGMAKITSFWISPIENNFAIGYFYEYFGNNTLIKPFLLLLLFYYCFHVFLHANTSLAGIKESPVQLSFIVMFTGMFITYFFPYIRSILVVPMLFNRYTIGIVPLFLMALAFGVALIHNRVIQFILVFTIIILSLTDIFFIKKMYDKTRITKTQFRELTQFMAQDTTELYPIVEEKTGWQHGYYLRKYKYNVQMFGGSKEASVDSILKRTSPKYDIDAFWIVGAHGYEPHLLPGVQKKLDAAFTKLKYAEFYDAWGELYFRKDAISLIPDYFPGQLANFYNENVVPLWGSSIDSRPVVLGPGKYKMIIVQIGSPAFNEFPRLGIYLAERKIGEIITTGSFSYRAVTFSLDKEEAVVVKINLENDGQDPATGQDRNAFIKDVLIQKLR